MIDKMTKLKRLDNQGNRMTSKQYVAALKRLGLTPASKHTAARLGLTLSQIQKIAAGRSPVTDQLALLLAMYLRHGLPEEDLPGEDASGWTGADKHNPYRRS